MTHPGIYPLLQCELTMEKTVMQWATELAANAHSVVAVDFRDGSFQTLLIDVKEASLTTLAADLIATRLNEIESERRQNNDSKRKRLVEVERAVEASGIPYTSINVLESKRTCQTRSNHELARMLSRIADRPIIYIDAPENIARESMRQLGMPKRLIDTLRTEARQPRDIALAVY